MKFKSILATALAAVVALSSCSKEENNVNNDNGETKPMTLTIKNNDLNGGTRGVDNVIDSKVVTLKTGWVLFMEGDEISQKLEIAAAAADGKVTAAQLAAGYTIEEVSSSVNKVIVLANLDSKHTSVGSATDLTTVKWALADIQANTDLSSVALFGQGVCEEKTVSNEQTMVASVIVAPMASRIQIPGVTLAGDFTFKLAGVFINNVYTSFNGLGAVDGKVNNGTIMANYTSSYNPAAMYNGASAIKEHATGFFPCAGTTYKSFWAHNVFPAVGGASKIPHIVFHFSDVKATDVIAGTEYKANDLINGDGNVYVTIGSYESTTEFKAGYIYTITTLSGKGEGDFGTDGTTPSQPGIEVPEEVVVDPENKEPETGTMLTGKVTVTVQNWTSATLKPEF